MRAVVRHCGTTTGAAASATTTSRSSTDSPDRVFQLLLTLTFHWRERAAHACFAGREYVPPYSRGGGRSLCA